MNRRFTILLFVTLAVSLAARRLLRSRQIWPFAAGQPVHSDALALRLDQALRRAPRPALTIYFTSRISSPQGIVVAARITRAIRSNGDWLERIENARVPLVTREIRFADGRFVQANDFAGAKSTFRRHRASNLAKLLVGLDPSTGCKSPYREIESREPLPHFQGGERIAGVETLKAVFLNGKRTSTKWVAPWLGCAELQIIHEFKDASGKVESTDRLTRSEWRRANPTLRYSPWTLWPRPSPPRCFAGTWSSAGSSRRLPILRPLGNSTRFTPRHGDPSRESLI
jgi:hypothetical protein